MGESNLVGRISSESEIDANLLMPLICSLAAQPTALAKIRIAAGSRFTVIKIRDGEPTQVQRS
jgi:hypothetical protein